MFGSQTNITSKKDILRRKQERKESKRVSKVNLGPNAEGLSRHYSERDTSTIQTDAQFTQGGSIGSQEDFATPAENETFMLSVEDTSLLQTAK